MAKANKTTSKRRAPAVERAEVKISLPESGVRQVTSAYGLRMQEAIARDVYFFDTPAFALSDAGLVLRARKTQDLPDDATVKLRPMKRDDIAPKWQAVPGLKVEMDVVGQRQIESCSLTCVVPHRKIDHVVIGEEPIGSLFTPVQHEFAAEYARVPVDLASVQAFGPIQARIWKVKARGFAGPVTFELWRLPNNRRVIEISYKAPIEEISDVQRGLDELLSAKGFRGMPDGDTKTRLAVRFFKGERSPNVSI